MSQEDFLLRRREESEMTHPAGQLEALFLHGELISTKWVSGINSGQQAWQQMSFPSELSSLACIYFS